MAQYYTNMLDERELRLLYSESGLSVMDIAKQLGCSANRVTYWMNRYQIKRRTISEAIYRKHNPNGDPFIIKPIRTRTDAKLLGLGLGLYWGEGTKSNRHAIRLGNTDPALINTFILFLEELFGVKREDLKFGLQIFSDIDSQEALRFWINKLSVNPSQFQKIVVTISGSLGTYRKKSEYGVVTVHYNNKKLRDILVNMLPR